ncbi:MAG TPA: hypothetical protein VF862_01290 [Gemmatimonadales bacterium]
MHWSTDTPWFDCFLITAIFAVGSICFGRFEEHRPRPRRLLKLALVTAAFVALSQAAGRGIALALLAVPLAGAAYVHLVWLPGHGVNGWTAEPRDRYLALVSRPVRRGRPA